jgi:hypothetical protein
MKLFPFTRKWKKLNRKYFAEFPIASHLRLLKRGIDQLMNELSTPGKLFLVRNGDFFAENRATIENHNFRFHRAVKENISEKYGFHVICYYWNK